MNMMSSALLGDGSGSGAVYHSPSGISKHGISCVCDNQAHRL